MRRFLCAIALFQCLYSTSATEPQERPMPPLDAYENYFDAATSYSLAFVRYRRRGVDAMFNSLVVNDVRTNSLSSGRPSYAALGAIQSIATTATVAASTLLETEYISLHPFAGRGGGYAKAALSSRTYTYRLSGGYNVPDERGWAVSADVSRRWGRSLSVEGVASDAWGLYLAAARRVDTSNLLQVTLLFNPTERLMQSPSTAEAFALSDNNLYNPAWGNDNGKIRSANVRTTLEPIAIVNHSYRVNATLELSSAAMLRFGRSSSSGLNWQGAPNPRPDYYRYMPSSQQSPPAADAIATKWQTDVNARQIDFDNLRRVNTHNTPRAKYIVENRVTTPLFIAAQSAIRGTNFAAMLAVRYETERNYKEIASLLGGQYWEDIDSFVEQDDDVKDKTQNNVRDPNRHAAKGDRFGYDYSMANLEIEASGSYRRDVGRFGLFADGSITLRTTQRIGHYEKENFPSGGSYGASQGVASVDANVALRAEYRAGTKFSASLGLDIASLAPRVNTLFISPRYRNQLNPHSQNMLMMGAQLMASYRTDAVRLSASLYYAHSSGGTKIENLYDDLLHTYVHYTMRNIGNSFVGLEAAAEIVIAYPLYLNVAVALQNNLYSSNPVASAYKESTGQELIRDETILYNGLHLSGSPQNVGVMSLSYQPRGWIVRLSAIFADGAYVAPSPLRRTHRAIPLAASPRDFDLMQNQEQLPSSLTIDLFGGYTHYFAHGDQIGIYVGVNNLLSSNHIVSSGYESNRLLNSGSARYPKLTPQPSRYYYALPINFFVNVTYRF